MSNWVLDRVRRHLDDVEQRIESILKKAEREKRESFTKAEDVEMRELLAEKKATEERIDELEQNEARTRRAARAALRIEGTGRVNVNGGQRTYDRGGECSYFGDLIRRQMDHDSAAVARLQRHREEVDREVELGERRDIGRVDGAGGDFVPPLFLMEDYAELARAGRVFADRFTRMALPAGTDSLNIPKVTGGAATAVQTADNQPVQETDMTTSTVVAPVRTIAGQQDVSLQLLEQSPVEFDRVVFADLIADYAKVLDQQTISGSGAAGQLQGVLGLSGINTVTYTDATPTVPELYPKVADAEQQVINNRFLPPDAIVMHPRRWVWHLAALDGQSRPLVVPSASGPTNAPGVAGQLNTAEPVGTLLGLPVFIDANIPANVGAGTNEDRIVVARFRDGFLYEGEIRTRVLPEVLSGNLTVRLQIYNYVAFASGRFPPSHTVIAGTGLVPPSL
jgi:HK97 family phage major capsid protein